MIDSLQENLKSEIKEMLKHFKLKNSKSELVEINYYSQYISQSSYQEESSEFPYIIVKILNGEDSISENNSDVTALIIMGVFDDNLDYQGHKDIIRIIEKIRVKFLENYTIGGRFSVKSQIKWAVNEDDFYPYFFGAIETNWSIPKVMPQSNEFV